MAGRIAWMDIAKGLGIILVVMGHVERGLVNATVLDEATWAPFDFYLYTFHMPLFMVLAGLSVCKSLEKPHFLRRKAASILHPYVVWSLVQGTALIALSGHVHKPRDLSFVLDMAYDPISPFWFLYVLFVFMVLVYLVPPSRYLLIGAFFCLLASQFAEHITSFRILYFSFFFMLGALWSIGRFPPWVAPLAAAIWFGWTFASVQFDLVAPEAGYEAFYSPALLPAALAGIVAVIALSQAVSSRALEYLGRNSLAIFAMHILAGSGARILLQKGLGIDDPAIHVAVGLTCGLLLPLLAVETLRRIGIARWFGFDAGTSAPARGSLA